MCQLVTFFLEGSRIFSIWDSENVEWIWNPTNPWFGKNVNSNEIQNCLNHAHVQWPSKFVQLQRKILTTESGCDVASKKLQITPTLNCLHSPNFLNSNFPFVRIVNRLRFPACLVNYKLSFKIEHHRRHWQSPPYNLVISLIQHINSSLAALDFKENNLKLASI